MRNAVALTLFAVIVAGLSAQAQRGGTAQAPPADLVLTNGRILTVENARPEVQALAVSGGRIEALGTVAEIQRLIGPSTNVIDLHGQLAIPGLIESHGHFTGIGEMKQELDLTTARTWDDIVAM